MRSYYRQYFHVFFRVIKQDEKAKFWRTVPCLSSFIKMKDQKKRRGFMQMFLNCNIPSSYLQTWHPFHVYVKLVGYPLPLSHDYSHWVYTPSTSYSSSHPWHLVSVSSSQCCQVILSDVPISLKIICLKFTSCPVLCTDPHVLVLLWSLHHLPLFHVDWWRIHQCLPSADFILSTSAHHPGLKSRNFLVPRSLQSLVATVLVFNSEFSSLSPNQVNLPVFDINTFIHTA